MKSTPLFTGTFLLVVTILVSCNVAFAYVCENPIIQKLGSLSVSTCLKQENQRNGLQQFKIHQGIAASLDSDPFIKSKRIMSEELVRCETLAKIPYHKISDFPCLKYESFINDSVYFNSVVRDNASFMKIYNLKSKRESFGAYKDLTELSIYPLNEATINQEVSSINSEFLGNKKDTVSDGAYFVVKSTTPNQDDVTFSGDLYLSIVEPQPTDDFIPDLMAEMGRKVTNAIDHGYTLNLKNIVITIPQLGDPFKVMLNLTLAHQKTFPYFFLQNSVTTSVPQLFDYESSITQEDTTDRYTTSGAYSTNVHIDAKSKIRELNFNLKQKFQNSGSDLYEWYETMRLNTRHFAADVLAVAEDGFKKRLNVVDKAGRRGLEVNYSDFNGDDTIDFKIHVKKSVMKGIIEDFVRGFDQSMREMQFNNDLDALSRVYVQ